MIRRKQTLTTYIALLLLAALLLTLPGGCAAGSDLPGPTNTAHADALPGRAEQSPAPAPEPESAQPLPDPEPEVSEPTPSPEPEVSEPAPSPDPEVSEPAPSPEPEVTEPAPSPEPEVPEPAPSPEPDPDPLGITSPRVGLYDLETLSAVYEKESDVRMAPGSMSKIATAVTALHYLSPDTVLTVGTELGLVQPGASISFIGQGHQLTLYQLLMGMLLPSGCDAAYTIAVNVARLVAENPEMSDKDAVDYFCGLMNDLAAELGAQNSHFSNPDGWDHEEHYTTVRDMALLAACAMEHQVLREIVATPEQRVFFVSGENITWRNTNLLLHEDSGYYLPGAVGMKTGTTGAAGNCLLSVVEKNGTHYIAVVAGSPTTAGRYEDTLKLLELIP